MGVHTSRRFAFLGLATVGVVFSVATLSAASDMPPATLRETTRSVRQALERLPYYGVFDFLAFGVEQSAVTLRGFAYQPNLGADAATAVKRVRGVDEVANGVETLPASQADDRIRWATFYRIYTDRFLSRYAPGGDVGARFAAQQFARYPGMQPSGRYPIHIIVRNGRMTLIGVVDNLGDKRLAELKAREVTGTFAVENELQVRGGGQHPVAFRMPGPTSAPDPVVQITSPAHGTIVHPGETVTVTVVSSSIREADFLIVSRFGFSNLARSLPAQLSLVVPPDTERGTYSITAFGMTRSSLPLQSGPVEIRVEPQAKRCEDFDSTSD